MSDQNQKVYLSYAWGGESERVVDELDADLKARGITLVRDKRDLGYKGQIREFMQEIGRAHAVVVVVSDKYLRSENCMFELVEIARNTDSHDRIFPVIMPDAEIYKAVNRLKYVAHWEDQRKQLEDEMRKVSLVNLQGITDDLNRFDTFRDQIAGLADMLKNMNALTPDMHEKSRFAEMAAALEATLKSAPATSAVAAAAAVPAPAPAVAASGSDAGTYLASIGERLTKAGYEPMRGERFGELRFKTAFNKIDKGFIANDHHRVLVLEEPPGLSAARLAELQGELQNYVNAFVDREICNLFLICVVTTGTLPADAKRALFATAPPSQDLIDDGKMMMIAVYSAADDDLLYPKAIPEGLDADFEVKIKQFLMP